jgi:hypothetical protein
VTAPSYKGRSPEEIITKEKYFQSSGYFFRAMSWLDYAKRTDEVSALLYACAEARMGIEYLLFEELVVSTGASLTEDEYEQCLKDRTKLHKTLGKLVPDYEALQKFTGALLASEPALPRQVVWNPKELMKSWGKISELLHWHGARNLTTENPEWRSESYIKLEGTLKPLWDKIISGQSMIMAPEGMKPDIRKLWDSYLAGDIDIEGVRIRAAILKDAYHAENT